MIQIIAGLFFNPRDTWMRIAAQSDAQLKRQLWYPVVMAVLPPAAFCYGTSVAGWKVFGGEVRRLTVESAVPLAILFYLALLGAVVFIGWMVHRIASTYHTETSTAKGIMMMAYACTPVYITGILGAYPVAGSGGGDVRMQFCHLPGLHRDSWIYESAGRSRLSVCQRGIYGGAGVRCGSVGGDRFVVGVHRHAGIYRLVGQDKVNRVFLCENHLNRRKL